MLSISKSSSSSQRGKQRGVSIVELLVGVALGLVLTTWAITLFVNSLGTNRKMAAETRVNQGLAAAANLIAREVRRAGYWGDAVAGTVTSNIGSTTTANPYKVVTADVPNSTITYNYAEDTNDALDNNEQFGFQLVGNVIKMQTASGTTYDVTDPNVLRVTSMTITPSETSISISGACSTTCTTNCPAIKVRTYNIELQGQYAKDSAVTRTLHTNVRVRNDEISGACPA